jgi:hypothetical protein
VKEELSQKKKEKVEEGEEDDFETKIISSYDNDKKDDVKAQGNNDDVNGVILEHVIRNSDSNGKKTRKTKRKSKNNDDGNVVILEHGIRNSDSNGKKTRKTKRKRKKDDITLEELDKLLQTPGYYYKKNNVIYEKPIQTAIQNSFACAGMCKKCQESNGSIEVITFTKIKSNKDCFEKKTSKLPHGFCKTHENCSYKKCEQKARYLFQCGHSLCKKHHDLVLKGKKAWFCDLCDIAVC